MNHRVLVVEDDPASSELMDVWLASAGYEVRCAKTIAGSQQAALDLKPHLILLDIGLGPESGLDFATWIRRNATFRAVPIIAVTAHAMVSQRDMILSSGCNAFMAKPVDFKELRAHMDFWLQKPAPREDQRVGGSDEI